MSLDELRAGGVAVGQVWEHVGGNGVPPSGLLVRVESVAPPFFMASYPDYPKRRRGKRSLARYAIRGFDRFYELRESAP